jgi:membrane protease YdiL (CAAX protease family)
MPRVRPDVIDRNSAWWTPWTLLVGVALGLTGVAVSVVLMRAFVGAVTVLRIRFSVPTLLVVSLFLGQYVAFCGVSATYLRLRGRRLQSVGLRTPSLRGLGVAVGGWLAALAVVAVVGMLVQASGADPASNRTARIGADFPTLLLLLIPASFLVIGPCEELLFRGVVQRRFREAFDPAVAVALSAGVFAAIHYVALTGTSDARLTTMVVLFFPSLVFGATYEYTDNVLVAALVHGAYDATLFALLYVAVRFAGIGPGLLAVAGVGTRVGAGVGVV